MKILMFGWEFPPHISGGLGTACYGLTMSLLKESVEILFVVPRAHGDEDLNLINASEIILHSKKEENKLIPSGAPISEKELITLKIPSVLSPYTRDLTEEQYPVLKRWNYRMTTSGSAVGKDTEGFSYQFSGTYGRNLLEEVQRYAEVAAEIGRKHDFEVIHVHDWLTFPAGVATKEISGKPLVVHVHATEHDRAGKNADERILRIEREGMQRADHIIAVSQWTKNILISKYNISGKKISVVHNGIIPKKNESSILPLVRISKQIITFLGRITYQKGPQYFVEAARKVLQKFPNAHFIMAGSGDLLPAMIERTAQLRIASRFHFTGFLKGEQMDQIWSVSNVYVMPSVSEPFGITPLEASHAGVPVIISNQSGVAEVMDHAIKIDFWDIDALANAICNVLVHLSLSDTLKKNSEEEIKQISWDIAAKKINTVYHDLVA